MKSITIELTNGKANEEAESFYINIYRTHRHFTFMAALENGSDGFSVAESGSVKDLPDNVDDEAVAWRDKVRTAILTIFIEQMHCTLDEAIKLLTDGYYKWLWRFDEVDFAPGHWTIWAN